MATKKMAPATEEMLTAIIEAPTLKGDAKCEYVKAGLNERIYFDGGKYLDRFNPAREFTIEEVRAMTPEVK